MPSSHPQPSLACLLVAALLAARAPTLLCEFADRRKFYTEYVAFGKVFVILEYGGIYVFHSSRNHDRATVRKHERPSSAAAWYLRVQAAVIVDRQSKTLLTDETLQRLRALRQRQWQKAAADFNKRQDAASARADASIAAWLAAHKERVALGMTTDGGTTTDHCDTEGMTEEVAAENAPPLW